MNGTMVTLVGNAATAVEFRETATGGMARFRFAVTPRRRDRETQVWTDGPTSFYTVWAWRTLATNLAASVAIGEPLVVHGRLKVREEERDGGRRTFVDVEAVAVGHDLSRGTAAFRRVVRTEPALTSALQGGTDGASGGDSGASQTLSEGPAERVAERAAVS
ncbi:single-stranded DNA-binding protein [Streptomyces cavourensis]|uniref:single-stranded DNA-binding protein n=1 Tax=Streptomyces cavourensis TaxID=67258 RepID=UPI001C950E11|nr:single-stranded DNA-binding protein [Streptomyces cavourensis]